MKRILAALFKHRICIIWWNLRFTLYSLKNSKQDSHQVFFVDSLHSDQWVKSRDVLFRNSQSFSTFIKDKKNLNFFRLNHWYEKYWRLNRLVWRKWCVRSIKFEIWSYLIVEWWLFMMFEFVCRDRIFTKSHDQWQHSFKWKKKNSSW